MNFAVSAVHRAEPGRLAIVEVDRDGRRREWRFGELSDAVGGFAGSLARAGVRRGDVVMTLVGNRPEWAIAMAACFHLGAVVLPCSEQLRARDIRLRLDATRPAAIVCDERDSSELAAARPEAPVLLVPDDALLSAPAPPPAELDPEDPCLITFTSGTSGEPKAVLHAQRYLPGQVLQAEHWLGAAAGDLVWCTAASGWSKSARNAFIAPWLRGAAALLHDARFDVDERLEMLRRERVNVLCMAPTEYRIVAKRATLTPLPALRRLVAAGEALGEEAPSAWHDGTGLWICDGYGQTETGQLTGTPPGERPVPGSMGRELPGVRLSIDQGELCLDPSSDPTFFRGYLGEQPFEGGRWRTGDRVTRDERGLLHFTGRTDDVIISAGYRIGPVEVESALAAHPAVLESAVVAAPDDERGAVVRAVVVLRDGHEPSALLARQLQEHVKERTAPYKYPRIVDFARELPKTASGKVRRAVLRAAG